MTLVSVCPACKPRGLSDKIVPGISSSLLTCGLVSSPFPSRSTMVGTETAFYSEGKVEAQGGGIACLSFICFNQKSASPAQLESGNFDLCSSL